MKKKLNNMRIVLVVVVLSLVLSMSVYADTPDDNTYVTKNYYNTYVTKQTIDPKNSQTVQYVILSPEEIKALDPSLVEGIENIDAYLEALNENSSEIVKAAVEAAEKAAVEVAEKAATEATKKVATEVAQKVAAEIAAQSATKVSENVSKEVTEKFIAEAIEKTATEVAEKKAIEVAETTATTTAEKVATDVVNKVSNQITNVDYKEESSFDISKIYTITASIAVASSVVCSALVYFLIKSKKK